MAGSFSDGVRLMTALQESTKISDALSKNVNQLHEASDKVKCEAENNVKELVPADKKTSVGPYIAHFRECMQLIADQSDKVSEGCKPVQVQCKKVQDFYSSDSDVTFEDIQNLIEDLQTLKTSAQSLYLLFGDLKDCVHEAEKALNELRNHCGLEAEKADLKAVVIKAGGGAGSSAAGGASVGLGIAGIFFPPLLIPAAVCGVGAVAGGVATGVGASSMDDVKERFRNLKNSLESTVRALSRIGDDIQSSMRATDRLIEVLNNADRRARNVEKHIWEKNKEEELTKKLENASM